VQLGDELELGRDDRDGLGRQLHGGQDEARRRGGLDGGERAAGGAHAGGRPAGLADEGVGELVAGQPAVVLAQGLEVADRHVRRDVGDEVAQEAAGQGRAGAGGAHAAAEQPDQLGEQPAALAAVEVTVGQPADDLADLLLAYELSAHRSGALAAGEATVLLGRQLAAVVDEEAAAARELVALLGQHADGELLAGQVGSGELDGLVEVGLVDVDAAGLSLGAARLELLEAVLGLVGIGPPRLVVVGGHGVALLRVVLRRLDNARRARVVPAARPVGDREERQRVLAVRVGRRSRPVILGHAPVWLDSAYDGSDIRAKRQNSSVASTPPADAAHECP
jgi:hypothetical protein